jgi:hypothetical protein
MAQKTLLFTTTGASTFTVPIDFNIANNSVICIGGGGGGAYSTSTGPGNGGQGAGFALYSNLNLTPGATVNISIGTGGAGAATSGVAGGSTWVNWNTSSLTSTNS